MRNATPQKIVGRSPQKRLQGTPRFGDRHGGGTVSPTYSMASADHPQQLEDCFRPLKYRQIAFKPPWRLSGSDDRRRAGLDY